MGAHSENVWHTEFLILDCGFWVSKLRIQQHIKIYIHFEFNTSRRATHSVIPRKPESRKKADWMPDQVRHDETTSISRCLRRGCLLQPAPCDKPARRIKKLFCF
jgi:hypothetical protein